MWISTEITGIRITFYRYVDLHLDSQNFITKTAFVLTVLKFLERSQEHKILGDFVFFVFSYYVFITVLYPNDP